MPAHTFYYTYVHRQKTGIILRCRRPAKGCADDIALYKMNGQRFMPGRIYYRNKNNAGQLAVCGKRHQFEAEKRTVMVFIFNDGFIVQWVMHRVFMVGKQVHELFGRGAEEQNYCQP